MNEYKKIISRFPHTTTNATPAQIEFLLSSLESAVENSIAGEVLEVGCHAGLTSVYIRRLLDAIGSDKEFHVYDSFQGLPKKSEKDGGNEKLIEGHFNIEGTWQLVKRFNEAELAIPVIHAGWFSEQEYPDKVCWAFFDGDFYSSILDSFEKVWDKVSTGGIVCVHDYGWDQLPGVKEAVDEYLGKDYPVSVPTFGLAVIQKQ